MKIGCLSFVLLVGALGCNSSGGVDMRPPTCDGGKCACSGSSCTCPAGTGCDFQCFGACTIDCTGPCIVHCTSGPCDVKCGGAMPAMCAHGDLVCNRNCQ